MGVDTVTGYVGPQTALEGPGPAVRQLRDGSLGIAEVHGRYYEAAYRKNLYTASVLGQAVTVVGTSMTGLILVNNSAAGGGGVNLALQKIGFQETVTAASATSVGLAWFNTGGTYGSTTLTPVTPVPGFLGAGGGKAGAYSAVNSTVGTPVEMFAFLHNTAAIATTGEDIGADLDLEGSILVPPGFGVCLCAVGASATGNGYIQWEEVPA